MVDNYSNVHRGFVQACARHGVMSLKQSQDILTSVQNKHGTVQRDVNEDTVRAIVEEINDKFNEKEIEQRLAYVHFEWDEMVGDFLVLCNTLATVGSSPVYNEVECNYMKSLIECIVTNPTHHIAMMTAIHLTSVTAQASQSQSTSKRLTKQRAEELLADWIIAGYFVQVNNGDSLTLGPRCIGEFRDTLLTTFPDSIRSCKLCSEICLKPIHCPHNDCDTVLDKRCFTNYVEKKKKCPTCKSQWESE